MPQSTEAKRLYNRQRYYAKREEILKQVRAYREANLEKARAGVRRYKEAHREELAAKQRAYTKTTREQRNQANRSWVRRNKEHVRDYYQKYRKERWAEKARAHVRKRRLLRRELDCNFTCLMRECLREAFQNRCFVTGETNQDHLLRTGISLGVDHVNSLSKGHGLTFSNACLLSREVNSTKGRKGIEFFTPKQQKRLLQLQEKAKELFIRRSWERAMAKVVSTDLFLF